MKIYRIDEVAQKYMISTRTAWRWVQSEQIPPADGSDAQGHYWLKETIETGQAMDTTRHLLAAKSVLIESIKNKAEQGRRSRLVRRIASAECKASILAAGKRWEGAKGVIDTHPYIEAKQAACGGLLNLAGLRRGWFPPMRQPCAVVPVYLPNGEGGRVMINTENIAPDGRKRAQKDCQKRGGFFPIGNQIPAATKRFYICEGWSTAAAVHAALNDPEAVAVCCFSAVFFAEAAENLLIVRPDAELIFCPDRSNGDQGAEALAETAAQLAGGRVIAPPSDKPAGFDYFDMLAENGAAALHTYLTKDQTDGRQAKD